MCSAVRGFPAERPRVAAASGADDAVRGFRPEGEADTAHIDASRIVGDAPALLAVAVRDDVGRLARVAIVHENEAVAAQLRATHRAPIDADDPGAIAQVARSGTLLYRPIVDAPGPDEPSPPAEAVFGSEGNRSLICA